MAAEPLAMCYPAGWRHFEGRLTPRFRTIQVCPKDKPARLLQVEDAVVRPLGGGRMVNLRRREFITLLGGAAAWPHAAHAPQQGDRVRRIGLPKFSTSSKAATTRSFMWFRQ